ncbi:glycoside hydrolase/deacetylase [Saitoella complicata NRRL Y-17804]|uniref:glycoside hydrolase/deacetylase n=1 Tax=Saitoella complicata (strain BCRC 22490 / CBS 7301 / JCM 7358 / NBRC 10748 / NRRL Y-17804) TaxID=698492 RepID=UPI0008677D2F|nr:glycoside hydrolase/deacetylase [Saitoella complicata NRRL Y-17804]ODQ52471.1 glycoside hydrolase/deacetylase [Saitoella complicata NRRL Y-17804]
MPRLSLFAAFAAASGFVLSAIAHPGHQHHARGWISRHQALGKRATITPDQTCGATNGYFCAAGEWCSASGWCGTGTAYQDNCQAAYGGSGTTCPSTVAYGSPSPDNTCGGTNGYVCGAGLYCSQSGYCGNTSDYITNCQAAFCGTGTSCATSTSSAASSGVSTDGTCGGTQGLKCPDSQCCSDAGYCGTGEAWCDSSNCQPAYGYCDPVYVPAGSNTSTVARPQLGSVQYGGAGIYDCVSETQVALTFDDGPYLYTTNILELLKNHSAVATFFITGNNLGKGPIDNTSLPWASMIQEAYANGNQIASHTWTHPDLSTLSVAEQKYEMELNEMALRNILGFFPTYMRPPYSSCTAESGCEDTMNGMGYHVIYFDVDSDDYNQDAPNLIQNSKNWVKGNLTDANSDNRLVIMHDIHYQTSYNLTTYVLELCKTMGLEFITVGECLGDPEANWYRSSSPASATPSASTVKTATATSKTTTTTPKATATTSKTTTTTVKTTTTAKAATTSPKQITTTSKKATTTAKKTTVTGRNGAPSNGKNGGYNGVNGGGHGR